ncbi:P-loop containing nucleoside triphosphate hydrolase protein [Cokeromyces recurvatus]|uniref:P-loop containing nucleoside triphosphate hydrolase protein n=1 Tax=Cokeromyces recurvatus TaxID=90255 RepID=UPI00222013DE|nr:P-loop containing nucleoside triphosphate hydrolase protein [Cokeromyces recurvatus]KAI7899606.1 P-loop containing nucleoside triphosphate hydrolase protein [Cokeromyces recurvatus]
MLQVGEERNTFVVSALGSVGTGKSSLLNAITGEYTFETGDGTNATTKSINGITKEWKFAPSLKYCHLIDTPGLVDSNVQDRQVIHEMTKYFKSLQHGVSAFFLVFNINDIRLDAYTQNMLILFHQLLGKDFWNFVIIVFTHVDEDLRDDLEDNIDAVIESQDGFVSEIRRIYKLSKSFQPSVIFTSTLNVRSSSYTQRHIRELCHAVSMCEARNNGKRFTCKWLRQILTIPNEEQKSNFIKESIKDVWSSMSNACQMQ